MSYTDNHLMKEEKVILKAKMNFMYFLPSIIFGTVLFVLGTIIAMVSVGIIRPGVKDIFVIFSVQKGTNVVGMITGGALLLIGLVIIISNILSYLYSELALTDKKVISKFGLLNSKSMDAPLNKINNISVEQGVFAKIFGYGKIVITTSSGLFNVPCVSNFDSFRMAAMEQIELYGDSKIEKNAEEIAKAINK